MAFGGPAGVLGLARPCFGFADLCCLGVEAEGGHLLDQFIGLGVGPLDVGFQLIGSLLVGSQPGDQFSETAHACLEASAACVASSREVAAAIA
ncbi:hypothetical protein GCM10029992_06820 [Glycomyces albus]